MTEQSIKDPSYTIPASFHDPTAHSARRGVGRSAGCHEGRRTLCPGRPRDCRGRRGLPQSLRLYAQGEGGGEGVGEGIEGMGKIEKEKNKERGTICNGRRR